MKRRGRRDVNYFPQSTFFSCGPACLRMMLSSLGLNVSEKRLIRLCSTTLFGTTCEQISEAVEQLGFRAEAFKKMSSEVIVDFLNERTPLIALIDASALYGGVPSGHFVVVLGIEGSDVHYHDPIMGPSRTVNLDHFLKAWEEFDFRGVRIWKPKKRTKK